MMGKQRDIRYLRCRCCREEFSERKNTASWRSKIPEARAVSIAEHLSEGNSTKATARLTRSVASTVERLSRRLGQHGQHFHDAHVCNVATETLQADERHGSAGQQVNPAWEGEVFDPRSKLVVSYAVGERNEALIAQRLSDADGRITHGNFTLLGRPLGTE